MSLPILKIYKNTAGVYLYDTSNKFGVPLLNATVYNPKIFESMINNYASCVTTNIKKPWIVTKCSETTTTNIHGTTVTINCTLTPSLSPSIPATKVCGTVYTPITVTAGVLMSTLPGYLV